eukprot:366261-Chlamydomonas_euryale.AAC.11
MRLHLLLPAQTLRREVELEDDNTAVPRTHQDDEYAHAGEADPKVDTGRGGVWRRLCGGERCTGAAQAGGKGLT